MHRKSPRVREDDQRLIERAAEWLNVLEDAGPEERAEFMDWIARSPRHLEEFLLATAVAREVGRIDLQSMALVQERLATESGNVAHLQQRRDEAAENDVVPVMRTNPSRRWKWPATLAAGIAAVTAAAMLWQQTYDPTFTTGVGEQRTVQLSDGTSMYLNTRSRVEVEFSDNARIIRLLEGEALFDVARDAQRPFRVQSGASLIQALGTEFNVLRRPLGTTVSVIEGAVQINARAPQKLVAGEEARIGLDGRVEKRQNIDVATAAGWRQHRLEFRTDALADIAEQFNRYNPTPQIAVIGEEIRARHYSGVFDAYDPGSLIEFLKRDPQLMLEQQGERLVIRAR